jgi:tetratricopeptide (TPR) repeat protein
VVRFDARRPLPTISVMLLIVALGVPREDAAQTPPGNGDVEDALTLISERIVDAQARGGPYAKELIDPLTRLSVFYQEQDDYAGEAAALEQALQVVRANYGLRSLEQAPLIRQRIENEESIGNYAAAWDLEQALLTLARRHPDDLRAAPIFHEIGDKRMELLESYLASESPPQLILGCFYERPQRGPVPGHSPNCHAGSRNLAALQIALDAQRNYANAIGVLRRQDVHSNDDLRTLENKLVANSYRYGGYHSGRQSLVRLIYDDNANAEPLLTRIERLVDLADWDLAFAQKTLALDLYTEIYEYLKKQGFPQATIDEIFSPEAPIVVPTFLQDRFSPEHAAGATAYVDVTFEITRFGTTRRISVADPERNVLNAAEDRASRWVLKSHFRPRVVDGQLADAWRVAARYYVHE